MRKTAPRRIPPRGWRSPLQLREQLHFTRLCRSRTGEAVPRRRSITAPLPAAAGPAKNNSNATLFEALALPRPARRGRGARPRGRHSPPAPALSLRRSRLVDPGISRDGTRPPAPQPPAGRRSPPHPPQAGTCQGLVHRVAHRSARRRGGARGGPLLRRAMDSARLPPPRSAPRPLPRPRPAPPPAQPRDAAAGAPPSAPRGAFPSRAAGAAEPPPAPPPPPPPPPRGAGTAGRNCGENRPGLWGKTRARRFPRASAGPRSPPFASVS